VATRNNIPARGSTMMQPRYRCVTVVLAWFAAWATPALSETYPSQPIRIVVPTPAGGNADLLSRTLAQKLGESGKTVVVENPTGGRGGVGGRARGQAPPARPTPDQGPPPTHATPPPLIGRRAL